MTEQSTADVRIAIREAMHNVRFQKQPSAEVFIRHTDSEFDEWTSVMVRARNDGIVEALPKVGLRHKELHAMLGRVFGRVEAPAPASNLRSPPPPAPTVSVMIGYLTKHHTANLVWEFRSGVDVEAQAADLASAVDRYTRKLLKDNPRLDSILDLLGKYVPKELSRQRIPAALVLLGQETDAKKFLHQELQELADCEDPASREFRRFALCFESELLSGP